MTCMFVFVDSRAAVKNHYETVYKSNGYLYIYNVFIGIHVAGPTETVQSVLPWSKKNRHVQILAI